MMDTVPAETPVTTPELLTVTIPLLALQVPPGGVPVSVVVPPTQTVSVPDI